MGETVDKESENWLVGLTSHGYQVQVAVPKNFVLQGTVTSSALIVGLSLLFIVILYLTLRQTFANYQKQVVDLVDSIQAIAQGQEGLRIDTLEKDQELLLIAETTNDMLDRLEKNIHDIYQLELSQKMPICGPCRRKSTLTSCIIRWSSCVCTQSCRVKMSWQISFMNSVVSCVTIFPTKERPSSNRN